MAGVDSIVHFLNIEQRCLLRKLRSFDVDGAVAFRSIALSGELDDDMLQRAACDFVLRVLPVKHEARALVANKYLWLSGALSREEAMQSAKQVRAQERLLDTALSGAGEWLRDAQPVAWRGMLERKRQARMASLAVSFSFAGSDCTVGQNSIVFLAEEALVTERVWLAEALLCAMGVRSAYERHLCGLLSYRKRLLERYKSVGEEWEGVLFG
jgi:hypothetical protein